MYRKLMFLLVLLFAGLAAVQAFGAGLRYGFPLFSWTLGHDVPGRLNQALRFFAANLAPALALWLLARLVAFSPGRRYPYVVRALKQICQGMTAALALLVLYQKGVLAGEQALSLAGQTGASPALSLVASQGAHGLLEMAALAAFLASPLYWLLRGSRVGDFTRATYEGWLEVRRRAPLWLAVLALAAIIQAYLTPQMIVWLLG